MIYAVNNPVIFPRLSQFLVNNHGVVLIGRKRSDFMLMKILLSYGLKDIPDVMVYDTKLKKWMSYDGDKHEIKLLDDVVVHYDYNNLMKAKVSLAFSFLKVYSSAEFGIDESIKCNLTTGDESSISVLAK